MWNGYNFSPILKIKIEFGLLVSSLLRNLNALAEKLQTAKVACFTKTLLMIIASHFVLSF